MPKSEKYTWNDVQIEFWRQQERRCFGQYPDTGSNRDTIRLLRELDTNQIEFSSYETYHCKHITKRNRKSFETEWLRRYARVLITRAGEQAWKKILSLGGEGNPRTSELAASVEPSEKSSAGAAAPERDALGARGLQQTQHIGVGPIREFSGKRRVASAEEKAAELANAARGDSAVLYIYGDGGFGKTQQAEKVAQILARTYGFAAEENGEEQPRILIDLRAHNSEADPLTPEEALRGILTELKVEEAQLDKVIIDSKKKDGTGALGALRKLYLDQLATKRVIIIDNAPHDFKPAGPNDTGCAESAALYWLVPRKGEVCGARLIITARQEPSSGLLPRNCGIILQKLDGWDDSDIKGQIHYLFPEADQTKSEEVKERTEKLRNNLKDSTVITPIKEACCGSPLVARMLLLFARRAATDTALSPLDVLRKELDLFPKGKNKLWHPKEAVEFMVKNVFSAAEKLNHNRAAGLKKGKFNRFIALSVLPGAFMPSAAQTLWGDEDCAASELLSLAKDFALLIEIPCVGEAAALLPPRYRMHDLVREAAKDVLCRDEASREALYFRRAAYYTGVSAAANSLAINADPDPDVSADQEAIEDELKQIRAHFSLDDASESENSQASQKTPAPEPGPRPDQKAGNKGAAEQEREGSSTKAQRKATMISLAKALFDAEEPSLTSLVEDLRKNSCAPKDHRPGRDGMELEVPDAKRLLSLIAGLGSRALDFFMGAVKRQQWTKGALDFTKDGLEKAIHRNNLGLAYRHQNNAKDAIACFETAKKEFQKAADGATSELDKHWATWGLACTSGNLGNMVQQDASAAFEMLKAATDKVVAEQHRLEELEHLRKARKYHEDAMRYSKELERVAGEHFKLEEDDIGLAQDEGNYAIVIQQIWRQTWWTGRTINLPDKDATWEEAARYYTERIARALKPKVLDYRGAANGLGNFANGLLENFYKGVLFGDLKGDGNGGRILKDRFVKIAVPSMDSGPEDYEPAINALMDCAIYFHTLAGNVRGAAACIGNKARADVILRLKDGRALDKEALEKAEGDFSKAARLFKDQGDTASQDVASYNSKELEKLKESSAHTAAHGKQAGIKLLGDFKAHLADRYGKLLPLPLRPGKDLESAVLTAKRNVIEGVRRAFTKAMETTS